MALSDEVSEALECLRNEIEELQSRIDGAIEQDRYDELKEEAESFVSLVRTQIAEVVRHIRRPDAYSADAAVTAVAKIEAALDKLAILEA